MIGLHVKASTLHRSIAVHRLSVGIVAIVLILSPVLDSRLIADSVPLRPNPDANGDYLVGGSVLPPDLQSAPKPTYTDEARKHKLSGTVILGLIIDADGMPHDVHVTRSLSENVKPKDKHAALSLDDEAVKVVEQYRFKPATKNGRPVPVRVSIKVDFRLY
jgi:TonB family protein